MHLLTSLRACSALGLLIASCSQAAIVVTDTGTAAAGTCTLAQAIYAANRANNPGNATPAGATTIAPLSASAATAVGIGTCSGATAGANTIRLPAAAAIKFDSNSPDNSWYGPNALPPIASTITIEGNGATLGVLSGGEPRLRFLFVGADASSSATPGYNTPGPGNLTLHNLGLSGGRQRGGRSFSGGGGAGMGGAIFNQGRLTLNAVTLTDNQAVGGSTNIGAIRAGGGMASDPVSDSAGGGGMGGVVPKGTSDAGQDGVLATGAGGAGGGIPNGLGGAGSNGNGGSPGSGGNGGGGGGGTGPDSIYFNAGGGGGFGGGPGGLGARAGAPLEPGGGGFGGGGKDGTGGGVGGGGAYSGSSLAAGGGGFGGGGGSATLGGKGGFGGGGGGGVDGKGGFGGGGSFPHPVANGGGGAGMGGAIFNHGGYLTLVNTTLSANAATGGRSGTGTDPDLEGNGGSGFGGAIFNLNGTLTVRYSTLAGNSVELGLGKRGNGTAAGGAIYSLAYNASAAAGSTSAALTLENSILSNSSGGVDLVVDQPATLSGGFGNAAVETTSALGANLVMSATSANGAPALPAFPLSFDPLLAAPADNGGPTATMALSFGSAAIDAGDACNGSLPTVDQRGYQRIADSAPDLGAYEFNAVPSDVVFANGFDPAAGCP